MGQQPYGQQGPGARGHMGQGQAQRGNAERHLAQQGQQHRLGQQHQHERHGTKGADARVFHDLQRTLAVVAPAQAIGQVGQTVFMEATGDPDGGEGAEHRRRPGRGTGARQVQAEQQVDHGGYRTHHQAHAREVRGAGAQHGGAETHPACQRTGHRYAREELQRQQKVPDALHVALPVAAEALRNSRNTGFWVSST